MFKSYDVLAKEIADTVKYPDVDFGFFAELYSSDASSADGGDIGSYPLSDLDSLYVAGALALEINGISDPVRSSFGWHIIKLLGMKDAGGEATTSRFLRSIIFLGFARRLRLFVSDHVFRALAINQPAINLFKVLDLQRTSGLFQQ